MAESMLRNGSKLLNFSIEEMRDEKLRKIYCNKPHVILGGSARARAAANLVVLDPPRIAERDKKEAPSS
jgi:hypothetical protein